MKGNCILCIFIVFAALFAAACRSSNETAQADIEVTLSARADPQPPAVGASTLYITLQGEDGMPIDNAHLNVRGDMDHAGMAAVIRDVENGANGEYTVPFEWTMGGGWIVTVTAKLPSDQGEVSQKFEFFVEAISRDSIIHQMPGMDLTSETTAEASGSGE